MSFQELLKSLKESVDFKKTVEIAGHKIEIGLLTLEEEYKANSDDEDSENLDGLEYVNSIRKRLLSYSIRSIDGEIIPPIVDVEENGEKIKLEKSLYVRNVLDNFPALIIDKLFEVYTDIREESDENIKNKIKYDWFKTPEEREEDNKKRMKNFDNLGKEKSNKIENEEKSDGTTEEEIEDVNFKKISEGLEGEEK